jgi:hypothetical protein
VLLIIGIIWCIACWDMGVYYHEWAPFLISILAVPAILWLDRHGWL